MKRRKLKNFLFRLNGFDLCSAFEYLKSKICCKPVWDYFLKKYIQFNTICTKESPVFVEEVEIKHENKLFWKEKKVHFCFYFILYFLYQSHRMKKSIVVALKARDTQIFVFRSDAHRKLSPSHDEGAAWRSRLSLVKLQLVGHMFVLPFLDSLPHYTAVCSLLASSMVGF